MTILIIGGGIAGLTTALSFHQIGVPCRVYETVQEVRPLGLGINLLPHAVRELTELGLDDVLKATAVPTAQLAYYSAKGQHIWSEPRGLAAGYAWPQYSVHRGALQMLLMEAVRNRLGPDCVVTGHHLAGWEEAGESVTASFIDPRDGSALASAEGALLIGADGIHSAVRKQLFPDEGPPLWNGAILWRGSTIGRPFLSGRTMIMAGHEFQKFVAYPIRNAPEDEGKVEINWIAERKFRPGHHWQREDWNRPGNVDDFLPHFARWDFDWLDIPEVIRAAECCYEFPMVDRDPLERWSFGRVTLLGDAAHPMYPIGSNGASQAILDARHLTRAVRDHGATRAALAAYEAERSPATAKIVMANRANGPEQVMQLIQLRAPDGFDRVEDVLSADEVEYTATAYKKLAGFDRETLNSRPSIV
jgi:5-methylphenazine-1-carboxylate 1-monooxygenase